MINNVTIRPFLEHIQLPPILEWVTRLEPKEVNDG